MTATQPTPMAPTSDLRPDPAPAATAEPAAEPSRWAWLGDHPIHTVLVTAIATVAAGLLFFSLTTLDNKIDKVDTKVDKVETRLTARIDNVETRLTARIDNVEAKVDGLDAKIDEVNLKLTAKIDEVNLKLTALINEINLKLTALIAGLEMTGLVDAAVEGRLPAAEPAEAEPADAGR